MTVTVQTPAVAHVANGITTAFAYAFLVQVLADMIVKVDGVTKTLGADYSISGLGVVAGGMVTFTVAPANGAKILLYRSIPLSRSNDYQANGDLPEDLIDADFDRIWMVLQDIASGNSVSGNVLRATVDEDFPEIPSATNRANKYLAFDAGGNPIASAAPSGSGAPVSSFMEPVLGSGDAATAQGLLEVPSETGAGASGTWGINITGNAGTATLAASATNLAGGGAGQIPYQAASGDTDMLAAGVAGQVLQSGGAAPPSWVSRFDGSQQVVRAHTANGYGSTNTHVRRFSTVVADVGSDITYADSATLGATFTIATSGVYAMSYTDSFATNTQYLGISLNSSQLTTAIQSITAADRIAVALAPSNGNNVAVSTTLYLPAGSVIRAHTSGDAVSGTNLSTFTISRVA